MKAISLLPEYGLTRAEERLLRQHSRDIVKHVQSPALVSELGSGNGRKTRWILTALEANASRFPITPIEISRGRACESCELELRDIDSISIVGVEREYLDGLKEVAQLRPQGAHLLVLFLGSNIGNFDSGADALFQSKYEAFCSQEIRCCLEQRILMKPVDRMLTGLRRSARRYGGIQSEPAGEDQP